MKHHGFDVFFTRQLPHAALTCPCDEIRQQFLVRATLFPGCARNQTACAVPLTTDHAAGMVSVIF
jgi:hypothetical protein